MSNISITNVDVGNVIFQSGEFGDDLLTFAGAATLLEGTILARDSLSLKLVPFVKGGATNQNGIPKTVLTYAVTSSGAGDVSVRVPTNGTIKGSKLVINADGDNSNVDKKVIDELRDYMLTTIDVTDLDFFDNQ